MNMKYLKEFYEYNNDSESQILQMQTVQSILSSNIKNNIKSDIGVECMTLFQDSGYVIKYVYTSYDLHKSLKIGNVDCMIFSNNNVSYYVGQQSKWIGMNNGSENHIIHEEFVFEKITEFNDKYAESFEERDAINNDIAKSMFNDLTDIWESQMYWAKKLPKGQPMDELSMSKDQLNKFIVQQGGGESDLNGDKDSKKFFED